MDFIDDDGLINSRPDEVNAENKLLWSLEYLLVKKLCGKADPTMTKSMYDFIEKCKIRKGLYNQRTYKDGTAEDYMSHDQLSSIFCFSYIMGLKWHKEIWTEIKRQKFRYDNINPDKPKRWLHPRDIIFYGILNDVWWCKAMYTVFKQMMYVTCIKKTETSGKLLAFVRVASVMRRKEKFEKLFVNLTKTVRDNETMGKWERCFEIYFPYENHPTRNFINEQRNVANESANWLF